MHYNTINMAGKKFGRLTVLSFAFSKNSHSYWNCTCSCGALKIIPSCTMRRGDTKSCGCISREKASKWLKYYATSKAHKGAGNPMWKGDKAGYLAIHEWLGRHYRKSQCARCESTKNLDWALKRGREHTRDRSFYYVLCRKCHIQYDHV